MNHAVATVLGVFLVVAILRDVFEAIILPQTVSRAFRPARVFYLVTWAAWKRMARLLSPGKPRQDFLGVYGPLSILALFAFWAWSLVLGFALLHYGFGSHLDLAGVPAGFGIDLYMSGTTFFTLGLGDVTPDSVPARILTVIEAGMGFAVLAAIIAYLPVLYQAFSRRELNISLLDSRAGSPPTAEILLRREGVDHLSLERLLWEWERWAAELMESHLSYPTLAYYRSQHQNQSWLAALTTILDASAFSLASFDGPVARQARLTFAMARHAVVDLSQIFRAPPLAPGVDRLPPDVLARMREHLARAGVQVRTDEAADNKLTELRRLYDPYVHALGRRFLFTVPAWSPDSERADNWRTSGWEKATARRADAELHEDDGG
jgi:ion channel